MANWHALIVVRGPEGATMMASPHLESDDLVGAYAQIADIVVEALSHCSDEELEGTEIETVALYQCELFEGLVTRA